MKKVRDSVRDSFVVLTLAAVPLCGSFCGEDDAAQVVDGGLDAHVADAEVIEDAALGADVPDVSAHDAGIDATVVIIADSGVPSVRFVRPIDGDVVGTETVMTFDAELFELVPAHRPSRDGEGHLHLFVDAPCARPGDVIVSEPGVVFELDEGQKTAFVVLTAGIHSLCLQAGTSAHVALPIQDAITIDVRE